MAHLGTDLFRFLEDLAANNDRDWFNANKQRYVESVQEPALDFITAVGGKLTGISPHFTADARTVGGSLFRIQRDTRFSKDKTPYKLNTGMQFRHEAGKDAHAPGFYLHIQPGESFMGVGLWRPETRVAYDIRARIAGHPDEWITATTNGEFTSVFELGGESLKRPPKGYDPDHELIDDLKRKDFIASAPLSESQVTSPAFLDEFVDMCRLASPFMAFLCRGVGVPY